MLEASLERRVGGLSSPIAPTDETLRGGLKIYRNNCAGCHGEPGHPSEWGTTSFYPRVPQLTDSAPTLTVPQMFLVVKHGIRYTGMGAWSKLLTDDEIWKVVSLVARIDSLPPPIVAAWDSAARR